MRQSAGLRAIATRRESWGLICFRAHHRLLSAIGAPEGELNHLKVLICSSSLTQSQRLVAIRIQLKLYLLGLRIPFRGT